MIVKMITYEEFLKEKNDLDWALNYSMGAFHTGSQVICNPPPESGESDYDIMFLCDETSSKVFEEELVKRGFSKGGSLHEPKTKGPLKSYPMGFDFLPRDKVDGLFHSWKKDFNIKVTRSVPYIDVDPKYVSINNPSGQFVNERKVDLNNEECLNYILTCSVDYYYRFYEATCIAKSLNLKGKNERIQLFQFVCDNIYNSHGNLIIKSASKF